MGMIPPHCHLMNASCSLTLDFVDIANQVFDKVASYFSKLKVSLSQSG
jgi:hypothetical protein